jgi:hypothetical protein
MRTTRVCVIGLVGIAVFSALSVYLGAAESQPAVAKPIDLEKRVSVLEERVAQLERQLDQVTHPSSPLVLPPVALPQQAPRFAPQASATAPQAAPTVPPNAVPREFNGQTYYIVPLGKEAAR